MRAKFTWVRSFHVLCLLYRHPFCVWSSLCTCRLSYIGQTGRILNKKRKNTVRPEDTIPPHYTDDDTTYTHMNTSCPCKFSTNNIICILYFNIYIANYMFKT
jgi:hypothetical protein